MALKRLGVPFEHWRLSEWDVNSCASYKAIHFPNDHKDYSEGKTKEQLVDILDRLGISTDGKTPLAKDKIARKGEAWLRETYNNFRATNNIGSIMNRSGKDLGIKDTDKYTHLLCYSFPCTDLSLAGKQKGMDKGSGTASALIWEVERLLRECKEIGYLPEILCLENVTQVHGKKNLENWKVWLGILEELGYHNYWQDMNSKNYGTPQNRDRCMMLSLLSDLPYIFPEPIPLKKRLKDVLDKNVPEKFYINNEKAQKLIVELIDKGVLPYTQREDCVSELQYGGKSRC